MTGATERAAFLDCRSDHRALLAEWPDLRARLDLWDDGAVDDDELSRRLGAARVAVIANRALSAAVLGRAPALRAVIYLGGSPSAAVDLAAAARRGISVRGVRGYGDDSVAQHAIALTLGALRDVAGMDRAVRRGIWRASEGREIGSSRFGVVGLGGIGRATAKLAAAIGFRVQGWNRSPVGDVAWPMLELDELIATSDVLSLHLTLGAGTGGFLTAARIAAMPRGAVLVNTARGALVDEAALAEALRGGHLAHAALDVLSEEPPGADHPLLALDNVTLTSHAAYRTPEAARRLLRMGVTEAISALDQLP